MSISPTTFKIPRPSSDQELATDVLDVIWQNADFYSDEATFHESVEPATRGQLGIYAATWYLCEVNNGGHDQFFYNSTGLVWQYALDGFELVGAKLHEEILRQAVALFPNASPSTDRQTRIEQLDGIEEGILDPLDDQLYDLPEDFEEFAAHYINSHPDEFFTNP